MFDVVQQRAVYLARTVCVLVLNVALAISAAMAGERANDPRDHADVARRIDELVAKDVRASGQTLAERTNDEDFLRRISFDLAGTVPSPRDVTLFGLDPEPDKRGKLIARLLASEDYASNWSRYWRDVVFMRATDERSRLMQGTFETWMTDQLRQNQSWAKITTSLVTATGDVTETGQTALIFAHMGDPNEIAAETARIFLGIQLQCANCHNHPTEQWKREQFHELAAFFPRVGVRPKQNGQMRSFEVVSVNRDATRPGAAFLENPERLMQFLDRNRDGKVTKTEAAGTPTERFFDQLLQRGDTNKDGAISLAELKKLPPPNLDNQPGRGSAEHFMPDLNDPSSRGTLMQPVFFATNRKAPAELADLDRRETLAKYLTSAENPWFAKAFVNRIWAEMLGEGFYMPIDDIGPERTAAYPDVLNLLTSAFVATDYDIRWLFRTIANTQTYQRQIRPRDAGEATSPFASATPTRLRADQLYNAVTKVLGIDESNVAVASGRMPGPYGRFRSPRSSFSQLFGFDPSTPQEDIIGNVPQALFLMNSPVVNNLIRADGNTQLGLLLRDFDNDDDALNELYLLVLAREPSDNERRIARDYIKQVGSRNEAFEDLQWGLLNSSEFLSKR